MSNAFIAAMTGDEQAMLLGFLYASVFDLRNKRRLTTEQTARVYEAQKRMAKLSQTDKFALVKALKDVGAIEWKDGRWTITAYGIEALEPSSTDKERGL